MREEGGDIVITKRDLIVAVSLTFCLTATLFMIVPTNSSPSVGDYDPWSDINDDGMIDIRDVTDVAKRYGSYGTAINKTALLLYLNETVREHEERIMNLEEKVVELENKVAILNATKLGAPDYDSGWKAITKPPSADGWKIFTHGLNTTNVLVYVIGCDNETGNIHQHWYGGQQTGTYWGGAFWMELTEFTIKVYVYRNEDSWDQVRVMVWKIPES